MFERFTEHSRRSLFFARLDVHERGGDVITATHVLLGVLREAPEAIMRFAGRQHTIDTVRAHLIENVQPTARVSTHVEIPFAGAVRDAFMKARTEADDLGHIDVLPEHLVLGVLATKEVAATALDDLGIQARAVRACLRHSGQRIDEA
jgi:ATP-dependent Clp protease ATP-binding subunit ClpC